MTFKEFHIFNTRKLICIRRNLYGVTVTLIHNDLVDIPPENLRQKFQHILLFIIHSLCPVTQDRHSTGENPLQNFILKP